jgi:alkylation response protein AidB-like acyl-CoA dehydrogenase
MAPELQNNLAFFDEAHKAFRHLVRRFRKQEIEPHIEEWEANKSFSPYIFSQMGQLGLLGTRYPEEYGGLGSDYFMSVVLMEELAYCSDGSLPLAVAVQTEMVIPLLLQLSTEEQRKSFLVPLIKGEKIGCLGVFERGNEQDLASVQTTATCDGKDWIIRGEKPFSINGALADFVMLWAAISGKSENDGFALFLVEKGTPGFVANRLDQAGMLASNTAQLVFEDCRIPADNLLADGRRAIKVVTRVLHESRLILAVIATSAAEYIFEQALTHAMQRVQFGHPIADFQVIAHYLAEMAARIEATKQLNYVAAWKLARGENALKETSMAKLAAGRVVNEVADKALQIHGGYGLMKEYPVQRVWRDYRLYRVIVGSSDEALQASIAKELGLVE